MGAMSIGLSSAMPNNLDVVSIPVESSGVPPVISIQSNASRFRRSVYSESDPAVVW